MNPYPGLRPFRADESDVFMGREIVQESVLTRVRISPLTLLVARSGVGKSSFLTCRLIPRVQEHSAVRYLNEWGGDSARALIHRELLTIAEARHDHAEKPLLVLDQFEDVFKLPGARQPLWDRLAEVVNVESSPANILISMREEWLGAWGESADYLPYGTGTVIRLAPLDAKELSRAIRRPPEIEGTISADVELAEALIHDLSRPTAFGLGDGNVEPGLLQLVCHRLWTEALKVPERRMTLALYERLGRADRISREFVWNELGSAGAVGARFTTADRVLWSGMTRHLVVAQGIKAITDPTALARKLRLEDLGFAGPAVVQARLPKTDREYLKQMPERRGDPPNALKAWISDVVAKGVQAGFLKQQHGLAGVGPAGRLVPELKNLFEISHDSLSELFQQFSLEFESWVRARWAKVVGVALGALFVLPFSIVTLIAQGLQAMLVALLTLIVFLGLYLGLVIIMVIAMEFLFELLAYPIVRRLARGEVPLPVAQPKERSKLREYVAHMARRLGFLPR